MENLFNYLETKYIKEQYKSFKFEFRKSENQLIIVNSFYFFKLKKVGDKYILSRFWKRGILSIIFKKELKDMNDIYQEILKFSNDNDLLLEELNLQYNISYT